MKYLLTYILMLIVTTTFTQPAFSDFYRVDSAKTIHTTFFDVLLKDDGYYFSGSQRDFLSLPSEPMIMKTDTNGQKIWARNSDTIQGIEWRYSDFFDTGKGYMAVAARNHFNGTSSLLFIDFNGRIIHKKDYVSTIGTNRLVIHTLIEDEHNHFYLYGVVKPDIYTLKPVLIKTDSIGNEIWRKYYGDSLYDDSNGISITSMGNNEFVLTNLVSVNERDRSSYRAGTQLIKIDSAGTILKEYTTPFNTQYISGYSTIKTKSGGLAFSGIEAINITTGSTQSYDYGGYVAKLDSNFQLLWDKRFGNYYSSFLRVKEKENEDLLITGTYVHNFLPDSVQYSGWLLSLNKDGDSIWQRTYQDFYDAAYPYHAITDVEILDDGRLLLAGYMNYIRTSSPKVGEWGWLIRTDSFGCVVPGCQLLDNTENVGQGHALALQMTVFPNPASDIVNFRFEKPINENAVIRVYSGLGQLVGEVGQGHALALRDTMQIEVSDWQSGIYFYGVYVEGQLVKQGQLLIRN
jgi:hypothetical protein